VQVGAGSALLTMARGTLAARGARPAAMVSLAQTEGDDTTKLCQALAELAVLGVPVSLSTLLRGEARPVWLPPTPLVTEEYRSVTREPRPELKLDLASAAPAPANDALVKLFQEQMEVLKAQTEIIRRQTEVLTGKPLPIAMAVPAAAPAAVPAAAPAVVAPVPVAAPAPLAAASSPVAAPAPPPSDVQDRLTDLVAAVSAFPRSGIDPDKRLIGDLGFDSLMVVELVGKATEAFPGLGTLPKSLFVNDPSVRTVAQHIEQSLSHKPASAEAPSQAPVTRYVPAWEARRAPALPAGVEPAFAGPVAILGGGGARAALTRRLTDLGRKVAEHNGVPEARTIIDLRPLHSDGSPREDVLAQLAVLQTAGRVQTYVVVHPPGSAAAGFAKALARELPDAFVKAIAVDGDPVDPIVTELTTTDATVEVSWTGGVRRVVALDPAPAAAGALRDGMVAVVSGGTRGLGLKIAVELARRHRAKVALLGRGDGDAAVAAVRAAGGDALFVRADVTDAAEVAAAVAHARRLGPIELVVHAAGVLADGPIAGRDLTAAARVIDTKAGGAEALLAATADDPLRTFLVLTSWAGRFGNAAQTDYAAANHWVAAHAQAWGARRGVRVVALDLPPWDGTDMVATIPEAVRAAMRDAGVTFLDDATGLPLVIAELGAEGPSGEVLLGRDVPAAERVDRATLRLTVQALPLLDDHRVNGHPVLPLVGAANLALEAAQRTLGAPARLVRLDVGTGVVVDGETTVWVRAEKSRGPVAIEIYAQAAGGKRTLAYRAEAERAAGALPELAVPRAGERPTLGVADFYAQHTFHGPRLQGVLSVDLVSDTHIEGTIRASDGRDTVDTMLFDSALQLGAFWAIVKHGRAGLPLGIDDLRVLAPIPPGARVKVVALLERAHGDLFTGHFDLRGEDGRLVAQLRGVRGELVSVAARAATPSGNGHTVDPAYYQIDKFPEVEALRQRLTMAEAMGIAIPYFNVHERVTNDTSVIGGREFINFASYNYLGFSGDDDVNRAVEAAVARYGTSVSASRVASGEKPLHRELEGEIARFLGVEDSIVLVGGHATNVGVIGHILGPGDLIIHDALAHDSILGGAKLSGAKRRPFPHNDWDALDKMLGEIRHQYKKVLIAIEGTYSMDGDIPRLDKFIEVKKRHKALLLVDEAHSFGVLGGTGRGIGELFDVARADVDMWMGTLSKTLASCGGYIAGSHALVQWLKYTCGAFVYSVGLSPPNTAASLAALRKLEAHPEIVHQLQKRARMFLELCRERGINTGMSEGTAVVPAIVGNSWDCLQLSQALHRRGINVQPILYPAVEEHLARLRFFITARHTPEQLRTCADALAEELAKLNPKYLERRANGEATRI
jgi:8-amino-7-oxononanoate synthase